jgi:DNA-binding Xre family transcriptional regulator
MLNFNPKNIFLLRGIEKTTGFLVKMGMSYPSASRYLKSKSQFVKIKDIEKLCVALNCTPNDLFEWKPDASVVLPKTHSLNKLGNGENTLNLQQLVKDVPSDKMHLIESLLDELKK